MAVDADAVFLADVAIDGGRFAALVYAGELPGGAFGWNDRGVVVTENAACLTRRSFPRPPPEAAIRYPAWCDATGVGRNFVGRALLAASSPAAAVAAASAAGLAAGRNYQIGSVADGSVTI